MEAKIVIRSEQADDVAAISDVVLRAYADVSYSDHREHVMVDRLRKTGAFDSRLSLLAEIDGEAVGHILLTKAAIMTTRTSVTTLELAPLSVVPEHQSRGVGKQLAREAHRQAAALGHGSILLVGIPAYYLQFGYEPLRDYPVALSFKAPDENCMILPLTAGALDGVAGTVRYADGWLDH